MSNEMSYSLSAQELFFCWDQMVLDLSIDWM